MSIFVLIISFLCLGCSLIAMKNLFKSNGRMQEDFIKAYDKGIKSSEDSKIYNFIIVLFSIFYTGMWVHFYIIAFNIFNPQLLILSLVAVFYLLQSIYGFFRCLSMFAKKEIKSGLINRVLNVVELFYVVYFLYYYVTIFNRGF
ncbi:MAG: hypothetical protein A2Y34_03940 [Spirochaetes bacterium GWC1_27_15]|nr:MAG: hypothetical protein A2Y34_03940 [Spirochaetes bacterium GWC1_27_15]